MPPMGYKYPPGSYKVRNKRGPKPFPGTRRKRCDLRVPPPQPIVRPKTTYNKKRKTAVLMYLIHHRISDARGFQNRDHYNPITRMREGMAPLSMEEAKQRREYWDKGAVVYRPPTFRDAENFWKIPHSTITHWWKRRAKYLPATEVERVKDYNPLSGISMGPLPLPGPGDASAPGDPQQQQQQQQQEEVPGQPSAETGPSGEPELIELDDDDDDSSDDSSDDDSASVATEDAPGNESGNPDGRIKTEDTGEVDADADADADADVDAGAEGGAESNAEGDVGNRLEDAPEDAHADAPEEASTDVPGDDVDVTMDAQHSEDVTEHEDAEGEDIEDSDEVHAAIFDLQTA